MATKPSVKRVELQGQNIAVEWGDGHESLYKAMHLRVNCGCAECVEEWSQRKLLDPASVPADLRAEDYLKVGRYAIQFLWSDAHSTGIYPFEMLRKLCPCGECKTTRDQG